MDLATNLTNILLVVFGTLGGITTLLFTMASIEPQIDNPPTRSSVAEPQAGGQA